MDAAAARRRSNGSVAPRMDPAARGKIGAELRAVYEDVGREPLPNEHVDLLLALRRKERELNRKP
jgi:hypothetical protein